MGQPLHGIVPALSALFQVAGNKMSEPASGALQRSGLTAADLLKLPVPQTASYQFTRDDASDGWAQNYPHGLPVVQNPFIPDPEAVAADIQMETLAPLLARRDADRRDRADHRGQQQFDLARLQGLWDTYQEELGMPSRAFQEKMRRSLEESQQIRKTGMGVHGAETPWNLDWGELQDTQALTEQEQRDQTRRIRESKFGQSPWSPDHPSTPSGNLYYNLQAAGYKVPLYDEQGIPTDVVGLVERELDKVRGQSGWLGGEGAMGRAMTMNPFGEGQILGDKPADVVRGTGKRVERIAVGALETTLNALADTEFDKTSAAYGAMVDAGHQPIDFNPKTGKQYYQELPRGGIKLNFSDPEGNPDFPQIIDFVQGTIPETDFEQYGGAAADMMMWMVPFLPNKLRAPLEAAKWGKNLMPLMVNMLKRGTTEGMEAVLKSAFAGYSDEETEFIRNISIGFGLGMPLAGRGYEMFKQAGLNSRSKIFGLRRALQESEEWANLRQLDIKEHGRVLAKTEEKIKIAQAKAAVRSGGELAEEMGAVTAQEGIILSHWNVDQLEGVLAQVLNKAGHTRTRIPITTNTRRGIQTMLDDELLPYYAKHGLSVKSSADEFLSPYMQEAQRLRQQLDRQVVTGPRGVAEPYSIEAKFGLDANRWINRSRNFKQKAFESTAQDEQTLAALSLELRDGLRNLTGAPIGNLTYAQAARRGWASAKYHDEYYKQLNQQVSGKTLGDQVDFLLGEQQAYMNLRTNAQDFVEAQMKPGANIGAALEKQLPTMIGAGLFNRGFLAARSGLDVITSGVGAEKAVGWVGRGSAAADIGSDVARISRLGAGPRRVRAPYRTAEQARTGTEATARPPMPGRTPFTFPRIPGSRAGRSWPQVTRPLPHLGTGGVRGTWDVRNQAQQLFDRLRGSLPVPHSAIPSGVRGYIGVEDAPSIEGVPIGGGADAGLVIEWKDE